jgi:hypothetical protein
VFSLELLVLKGPFVAKPFQTFILLQHLQNAVIATLALCLLDEGLPFCHCLNERLKHLLTMRLQGQNSFNERTAPRPKCQIQYEETNLYELIAVYGD